MSNQALACVVEERESIGLRPQRLLRAPTLAFSTYAKNEFYARYQLSSERYALYFARLWNFRLPREELLSAAHLGLCRAIAAYSHNQSAKFETYLFLRVRAEVYSEARLRLRPKLERELASVSDWQATSMLSCSNSPEEKLERKANCECLDDAMKMLPKLVKRVLELVFFQDLTIQETARQLRISRVYASQLKAKGLVQLKKQITKRLA